MYERMWCRACGTVTEDFRCDCNSWPIGHEMWREPKFVNYADSLQSELQELLRVNNGLEERIVQLERTVKNMAGEIHQQAVEKAIEYPAKPILTWLGRDIS